MEITASTTMCATVCQVCPGYLLVCNHETDQEVLVHTNKAHCFSRGDCVCIRFNGIMTASIPPQITATCIRKVHSCCCC